MRIPIAAALVLFMLPAVLAESRILVNGGPASFASLETDRGSVISVHAGKDDVVTFVQENGDTVALAESSGATIFSMTGIDRTQLPVRSATHGTVPVIVMLNVSDAGRASFVSRTFESAKQDVLGFASGPYTYAPEMHIAPPARRRVTDLRIIDAIAFDVESDKLDGLAALPTVRRVELDGIVYATLQDSVPLINATAVWRLQNNGVNLTGANVTIAIIDTGIDYTHPDLGGCLGAGCKVAGGYDFVNSDSNPMDDHGHGTHVAATAAGNGTLLGVAPGATLYGYKVLNSGGWGSFSDVIAGIDRATDPNNDGDYSDHLDILSMSLGGSGDENSAVSMAVNRAVDRGVIAVVAAGNSGSVEGAIGAPGAAQKAITVAAADKNDAIAYFSSRGPTTNKNLKPELTAPGVSICAAEWDSAWSTSRCRDTRHVSISGTSMATPHVAGLAALILQKNRSWSPDMIRSALVTTTKDLGQSVFVQGSGRVNALNASNAKLLAFPATVSFGQVSAGTLSRAVVIRNVHNETMAFNVSVTNVTDGTTYEEFATANVSSAIVAPNANATVNLTVAIGSRGGTYYGYLNITSGRETYRVPFSFVRLTEVRVRVLNGTTELRPLIILLVNSDQTVKKWAYYWSYTGGTYTFTVPEGNYTAVALGDAAKTDTTYILSGNASAAIGSNVTISLNLAAARNFTGRAQGFSNETLTLFKWQFAAQLASGSNRFGTSMTYLGMPFEGNRTVYLSDSGGWQNVSTSFSIIGYPKRALPSYESRAQWDDDSFTAADTLYFAAWNVSTVTNATPRLLNFSPANFSVFNYTYGYPGYDPSFNASFDSYASVFFWISPFSSIDISPWLRTAAGTRRTIYVMDAPFGFWHYHYLNYLKTSVLGGDWRSEFGAMAGQYEDDTLISFVWPYGVRFRAGDSREAYFGTSYLPAPFANTNATVALGTYTLRGTTNQTYLYKARTVTWSSTDGTSGIVALPTPTVLVYRNNALVENLSSWTGVSVPASSGSYKVNITLPTAYPLFNVTYVDANFTLPFTDPNPPQVTQLNVSPSFVANGTLPVDFTVSDSSQIAFVTAQYSYDRTTWLPLVTSNQSGRYNGTISVNQTASELSVRITAADTTGNWVTYRFLPVSMLRKQTDITLAASAAANPGDTVALSGFVQSDENLSQVRLAYETDGAFYQYDRSGYARTATDATRSGRFDVRYAIPANYSSPTLNITVRFNGTGAHAAAQQSTLISINVSTTTPLLSNLATSPVAPDANDDIRFSVTASASNGIGRVRFESNFTGSWVNYTMTNASTTYNYTMRNSSVAANARIGWRVHANSSSGENASSSLQSLVVRAISASASAGAARSNINPGGTNTLFCDYTEDGDGDIVNATVLADIGGNSTMTYNVSSGRYEANYSSSIPGSKAWTCYASKGNYSSAAAAHSFAVSDSAAPSFANVTAVGTLYKNDIAAVSVIWSDSSGLDAVVFSSNASGSWANATSRANGAAGFNASANITAAQNGQRIGWLFTANDTSGNMNNYMPVQSFVVQNREPHLSLDRNDDAKGYGEQWAFSVNVSDADGDSIAVRIQANGTALINVTVANGIAVLNGTLHPALVGTAAINITASDGRASNSTSFLVTVEKDDVTVNVSRGENATVQRFGYRTLPLGITVFDTDAGTYVNSTARVLWTRGGTTFDDYADCTLVTGSCTVLLDPDHLFTIGSQQFLGSVLDNNTMYKAANSSPAAFGVNGTLFTSVNGPSGSRNFNETVRFNTTVTDDVSSVTSVNDVFLEYKFSNAADWRTCTPVTEHENGVYTCDMNASSFPIGFYDVRYTAQKENYTSFNTTVFHQFAVRKTIVHRERINVTSFATRRLNATSINTTIDFVPRSNLSNMDINLTLNSTNPVAVNLSVLELGKYLRINVSDELDGNLSYAIIRMNYTEAEINQSGAREDSLRIYKFNGTHWNAYDPPNGGVNTTEKYVWANVTSFSDFAMGGTKDNGVSCATNDECSSGNCAADYDGNGRWCAASGNCVHDYIYSYASGSTLCDSSTLQTCASGSWSPSSCSSGCSTGACVTTTTTTISGGGGSSGGGGGGGGGGGYAITSAPEDPSVQTVNRYGIVAGSPAAFVFARGIVHRIDITPQRGAGAAAITIRDAKPVRVPAGLAYSYVNITSSVEVTNATVQFSIDRSWMQAYRADPARVALNRFTDSWQELPTALINESPDAYTYRAYTPGFSLFAITAEEIKTNKTEPAVPLCGNSIVEEGEACDGTADKACSELGFTSGQAACSNCTYSTAQCVNETEPLQREREQDRGALIAIMLGGAACVALAIFFFHSRSKRI